MVNCRIGASISLRFFLVFVEYRSFLAYMDMKEYANKLSGHSFILSGDILTTQVNRMSRSRRVLAIGGKQRILGLDMVCIETILLYLDSL